MTKRKTRSLSAAATPATAPRPTMTPAQVEEIERQMEAEAGRGISNRPEDVIIPQVRVLQPMSPQILDGPEQVGGAHVGDFLLAGDLIVGKLGFWFQPCGVKQLWLRFKPLDQGGGYVESYPYELAPSGAAILPPGVELYDPPRQKHRFRNGGDECIHYRQWCGLVWRSQMGIPFVIPFKSSGHTVARNWMFAATTANLFKSGKSRPLYGQIYKLTTSGRKNAYGQWQQIDFSAPLPLNCGDAMSVVGDIARAVEMGRALGKVFESGETIAEVEEKIDEELPL